MANMEYCRFQNTLSDLRDCKENLFEELSIAESIARAKLVALCVEIADECKDYDAD